MADPSGYGEWLWIHDVDADPPLEAKAAGRVADGSAVCLPPAFASELKRIRMVDRVNRRCGTLLDWYEEEDVTSADALGFIAGFIDAAFPAMSDSRSLADDVVEFLMSRARAQRALTFRL